MNTKQILTAMAVIITLSATAAVAQTAAPAAPSSAAPTATATATAPAKGEKFDARKAKVLQRLEKRAAEVQQKQACVQAATTKEALQACFPNRGKKGGHKGGGFGMDKEPAGK